MNLHRKGKYGIPEIQTDFIDNIVESLCRNSDIMFAFDEFCGMLQRGSLKDLEGMSVEDISSSSKGKGKEPSTLQKLKFPMW